MELLSELGLGLSAFLAATILALSSELVLSIYYLLVKTLSPSSSLQLLAIVAGSIVNYLIGRWGAKYNSAPLV